MTANIRDNILFLADQFPKSKCGKKIASNILVLMSAYGDGNDLVYIIDRYGVTRFQEGGIVTAIGFAIALCDIQKLKVLAETWPEHNNHMFFSLTSFQYADYYTIANIMDFPTAIEAESFYEEQIEEEWSWPKITIQNKQDRINVAKKLCELGINPGGRYLAFAYSDGLFDLFDAAQNCGFDLDINCFEYLYSNEAKNPKFFPQAGAYFLRTALGMPDKKEALRRFEYLVKRIEESGHKLILTTNMINQGFVEFLFDPVIISFTADHIDCSYIRKTNLKKVIPINQHGNAILSRCIK